MIEAASLIAARVGTLRINAGAYWIMSLLIDPLTEYWIVDDTLLSDNDSVVSVVYLVLRLEAPRMSCMSTPLFNTRLIGLEVSNIVQSVIGSGS